MHLLDINILLAIADPQHVHHARSRSWFLSSDCQAWATCPITENGFIRILSHPSYPGFQGDPQTVREMLTAIVSFPGHQFWSDNVTILNSKALPTLPSSKNLTDHYLLALAIKHESKFATLDQRIDPSTIPGGANALVHID